MNARDLCDAIVKAYGGKEITTGEEEMLKGMIPYILNHTERGCGLFLR